MAAEVVMSVTCVPPMAGCVCTTRPSSGMRFWTASSLVAAEVRPGTAVKVVHHHVGPRSLCHQQRRNSSRVKSVIVMSQGGDVDVTASEDAPTKFDVSSNCVQPVFRSSPWLLKQELEAAADKTARILFLSEGNVCRSVYAEAIFNGMLLENGLQDEVQCASKGTKNYNEGEPPDERALQVANEKGLQLGSDLVAAVFDHRRDIMEYDLVLVMDKFNATDVLKEISVYDTIDKGGNYSSRVHRLGDFAPLDSGVVDIDDPLYGNTGGPHELENLRTVYSQVQVSCKGLIEHLLRIQSSLQEGESLKEGLVRSVKQMKDLEWMVPPMLQKR